jgi:renalase
VRGHEADVLIVGAGLSGLTAARELHRCGVSVTLVDKGRSVGGRLATRRVDGARLDHGAQFFTVRGDDFRALVDSALTDGVVHEWCLGFGEPDGYPRYAGTQGMNAFAKWLAVDLDVHLSCQIEAMGHEDGRFVATADTTTFRAPTVIMTAPVPQSLALLRSGGTAVAPAVEDALAGIDYFATLALLVTFAAEPAIPPPGGVQLPETEPFTFIGDNMSKGTSEQPAVTFHANHEYSRRRYNDDPQAVLDELAELARPWFGNAEPAQIQLKKWRYAGPVTPLADRVVVDTTTGSQLLFAGDAFGGPKVEGAFNSGLAAARTILETQP